MSRLDFFKRKYDESTVLQRARKHANGDDILEAVLELLYFTPNLQAEDLQQAGGNRLAGCPLEELRHRYLPWAQSLIERERARNSTSDQPKEAPTSGQLLSLPLPEPGVNLDDMEQQAITIVLKANTGITLDNRLKRWTITLFKTFGPYAVLALTVPESYWVFSHLFAHLDSALEVMTWLFATLVDLGYTALTVLVAMNKEAMGNRLRAGLAVERHERRAVTLQSWVWWLVAGLDVLAQASFLLAAVQGQHAYDARFVDVLIAARILSLFLTMFIVSFAGTELMTPIDRVTNEQIERAVSVKKVMGALGEARAKQLQARIELEQALATQELQREGYRLLADIYADARNTVRAKHGLPSGNGNGSQKRLE